MIRIEVTSDAFPDSYSVVINYDDDADNKELWETLTNLLYEKTCKAMGKKTEFEKRMEQYRNANPE